MMRIPFNSSPVLGPDGTIYAAAGKATARYEDDGSALYAVRPKGQLKWACFPDLGISGDPLLAPEGSIYIQATFRRKVAGGTTHDTVVTLDPETGRVLAPKELNTNVHGLIMDARGIFYCFPDWDQWDFGAWTGEGAEVWVHFDLGWPVVHPHVAGPDGTMYVCAIEQGEPEDPPMPYAPFSEGARYVGALPLRDRMWLYALGEGGRTVWRRQLSLMAALFMGPAGDVLVAWQDDGLVQAFDPGGSPLWAHVLGASTWSVPGFGPHGDVCLCTGDGRILLVGRDGTVRWALRAPGEVTGGPRAAPDGTCYFGCADGSIYALGPEGVIRWQVRTGGAIYSRPAIGADGTVYVGSDDGYLYALHPNGEEAWRFGATIERSHP